MSKIICDVCGSSYSETATQCPICGTAKAEDAKPAVETVVEETAPKGGKFSKPNTRKPGDAGKSNQDKKGSGEENPSNLGMIIIVTVLLLAIVAVCVFIAVRFMDKPDPKPTTPTGSSSTQSTAPSTAPTTAKVPCTGIELVNAANKTLSFNAAGKTAQLDVKALPENTTDDVVCTYTSSNPSVALVDQSGKVTAVADGTATITIAYNTYSIKVDVTCTIAPVVSELKLLYSDVTLSPSNGLTLKLYNGEVDAADITWTSADETVAIVENGVVTAVGNNNKGVIITATYGELKATCLVRVTGIKDQSYQLTTGYTSGSTIMVTLTMGVDESFNLKLIDKENKAVTDAVWTFSPEGKDFCTKTETAEGVKVTAVKATKTADGTNVASGGYVYVQTEYENEIYRCRIYINAAAPSTGE